MVNQIDIINCKNADNHSLKLTAIVIVASLVNSNFSLKYENYCNAFPGSRTNRTFGVLGQSNGDFSNMLNEQIRYITRRSDMFAVALGR